MKEYFIAKKAAKAQVKALEERKLAEKKENERFGKLLVKYFDHHGKGLSKSEIMEVNNYLKQYVVLADDKEINNYTSLVLTYSTIAKSKFKSIREDLTEDLNAGEIISKADAAMIAENVIISRPRIETTTVVNGKLETSTIVPEKKYVVNIDLNSPQIIQSSKYEKEEEDVMRNIDNQIQKWQGVRTLAYVGARDDFGL